MGAWVAYLLASDEHHHMTAHSRLLVEHVAVHLWPCNEVGGKALGNRVPLHLGRGTIDMALQVRGEGDPRHRATLVLGGGGPDRGSDPAEYAAAMITRSAPPVQHHESFEALTAADISAACGQLARHVLRTPVVEWPGYEVPALLAPGTRITAKLELLQRTGSFKARGAMVNLLALTAEQRARGITAVSAGNHAIAVAWAARAAGVSAKVVMIGTANQRRIASRASKRPNSTWLFL